MRSHVPLLVCLAALPLEAAMGMTAVRTGEVKYLSLQGREELYDLARDPGP
ncbi:MAG TPA: hypothetical protein VKA01_16645 [Vicinamibacteria bacterium]|nr:hypothetical protein [Vicinamibacteria bacterium]